MSNITDNEDEKTVSEVKLETKPKTTKSKSKAKGGAKILFFDKDNIMAYLPALISLGAIFLSLFVQFIPAISATLGGVITAAIFFFISFLAIFGALIIQVFSSIKSNTFKFDLNYFLICLAFFVLLI